MLERAGSDDDAFASLYQEHAPMARRIANGIVQDAHAAEDLVQEAFYLVLRNIRRGKGPTDSFSGYVASTVRRLAYRYSARQGRIVTIEDATTWERPSGSVMTLMPGGERITTAWASLPHRWRTILWLIEVDLFTPAELAAGMSMTPSAVSSLATRARRALRTAYASVPQTEKLS
nr:sigma-70 family RNA polymerase sigma factor [Phytoactinopolyspora alkaliphila]